MKEKVEMAVRFVTILDLLPPRLHRTLGIQMRHVNSLDLMPCILTSTSNKSQWMGLGLPKYLCLD